MHYVYIQNSKVSVSGRNDVGLRLRVRMTVREALDALDRYFALFGFSQFRKDVESRRFLDDTLYTPDDMYIEFFPYGCNEYGFELAGPVTLFEAFKFLDFVADQTQIRRVEHKLYEDNEIVPDYYAEMRRAAIDAMGRK